MRCCVDNTYQHKGHILGIHFMEIWSWYGNNVWGFWTLICQWSWLNIANRSRQRPCHQVMSLPSVLWLCPMKLVASNTQQMRFQKTTLEKIGSSPNRWNMRTLPQVSLKYHFFNVPFWNCYPQCQSSDIHSFWNSERPWRLVGCVFSGHQTMIPWSTLRVPKRDPHDLPPIPTGPRG